MLPDIQKDRDRRGIEIDQVGVTDVRYPLTLPLRDGGDFTTVANLAMTVSLPHYQKGTHMSRFMIALNDQRHQFKPNTVHVVLGELMDLLEAQAAYLDMEFPIFLPRRAPVTAEEGLTDYRCNFHAMKSRNGDSDMLVGVRANVTTCCPCSKEISTRGAHNQRSEVSVEVRPKGDPFIWFEDLIDTAERNASSPLYPILKRPDEKHVTEQSYDNPKFAEDVVRDVAKDLLQLMEADRISWFYVSSNNHESIHNHNAFAKIERGVRGPLMNARKDLVPARVV